MSEVRVRFAPSPTGYLHVGGARTALYNYLFAKKNKGKFILRIEDTDLERSTEESLKMVLEDLTWLGLKWDEGIDANTLADQGEYGPYRQSQRLDIYKKYVDQLLAEGKAYYCFMTDEEAQAQRDQLKAEGKPYQPKSPYRSMSADEAKAKLDAGEKAAVRFKVSEEKTEYKFTDIVRGEVVLPSDMIGDFVIWRSNGMPVYNFCCAMDDALMKISHVFRAEEHLSNTLRQMMIYESLGFDLPQFGHMSIILGADKQKLSKRHGATSCGEYKNRGYLDSAINNFLALLGWSPADHSEIMSMEELIEKFDETRLHSAAAVFDEDKFKWMNATHLRAMPNKDLWDHILPFLTDAGLEFDDDEEWKSKVLEVYKTSMETLADSVELLRPLSPKGFALREDGKEVMSWEDSPAVIGKWKELVAAQASDYISTDDFKAMQNQIKTDVGVKGKQLFQPIRTAITGSPEGAELKVLVPLIKKEELIKRANTVLGE